MNKRKETPLWQRLIETHCIEKGRYGFTIPFLVGAERQFSRPDFDINTLFNEIKESNKQIIISNCADLDEYILGFHKREYSNINDLSRYKSLYVNSEKLEEFKDYLELLIYLKNKYDKIIDENKYSIDYDTKKWEAFNEKDLITIRNEFK